MTWSDLVYLRWWCAVGRKSEQLEEIRCVVCGRYGSVNARLGFEKGCGIAGDPWIVDAEFGVDGLEEVVDEAF